MAKPPGKKFPALIPSPTRRKPTFWLVPKELQPAECVPDKATTLPNNKMGGKRSPRKPVDIDFGEWLPNYARPENLRVSPTGKIMRQMTRDIPNERLVYRDEFGQTEFQLYELPGRFLTWAMLEGVANFMMKSADPRSVWISLKRGLVPAHRGRHTRPPKPKLPKDKRRYIQRMRLPLSTRRQAIVSALLDLEGCKATRERAEDFVRAMTQRQVHLWNNEPDVKLHHRRLLGEKSLLKLPSLLDELNAAPPVNENGETD